MCTIYCTSYASLAVFTVGVHFLPSLQFAFQHKLISETELKVANGMYDACVVLIDAHTFIVALDECQVIDPYAAQCHDQSLCLIITFV